MRGYKVRTGTQTLWSLLQQSKLNIQLFPVYTCQLEANEEEKSRLVSIEKNHAHPHNGKEKYAVHVCVCV